MKNLIFKNLILFESDDYLVISKPPFIATLEDRAQPYNILSMAREYHEDVHACHRLDKETSGVLVLAKNMEAYRHLSLQFQNRTTEKEYHAFVGGVHHFEQHLINIPLRTMSNGIVKVDKREGKEAETYVDTLKTFRAHSLVSCKITTGRMHQIRVHLAQEMASIIGDTQYGGHHLYLSQIKRKFNLKKGEEEKPLIQRVALHAYRISFENLKGKRLSVEAPYPKDISALLNQLERNT